MQTNAKVEISKPRLQEVPAQASVEPMYPKFQVCDVYMHGIGDAINGPGKVRAHGTLNEVRFRLDEYGPFPVLALFVPDPEKGFKSRVAIHSAYVTLISDTYELDANEEMAALSAQKESTPDVERIGPRVVGVDFGLGG